MDEEKKQECVRNNAEISRLLAENEKIIKKAGYNPPIHNYALDRDDRITVPAGYIRTSGEFWQKYHLTAICDSKNVKNNISYALQMSDYYNFLVNRFNVWGSIETMLYKQAFVNNISIIEALILECSTRINNFCKSCSSIGKCKNNFSRADRDNMKHAVEKMKAVGILNMSDEEIKLLIEMYDLRNKIHIRLNDQNEFLDNKYNMDLYNKSIILLQKVDRLLYENGVQYYTACMGFDEK